eukprot:9476163-Pyramimonas_sp.AAC.1
MPQLAGVTVQQLGSVALRGVAGETHTTFDVHGGLHGLTVIAWCTSAQLRDGRRRSARWPTKGLNSSTHLLDALALTHGERLEVARHAPPAQPIETV